MDTLGAQPTAGPESTRSSGSVEVLSIYLAARIADLESRSPRFSTAMDRARTAQFRVVIGTPEQVMERLGARRWLSLRSTDGQLADFLIYLSDDEPTRIELIVIRVHLDRVLGAPSAMTVLGVGRGRAQRWVDATVDAALIHELWGHLAPIVDAGGPSGLCADPEVGQPPAQSCVMQRENAMRAELALAPRAEYRMSLR
jgi:hypothetical protein